MLQSAVSRSLKPSLYAHVVPSIRQSRYMPTMEPSTHSSAQDVDLRTAVAEFIIRDNGRTLQRVQMHTPAAMIGRTQSADIQLDAPVVSRQHARLARIGNEYWLVDLSSTNGTKVNGQRINSVALRDGDRITFGTPAQSSIEILFRINN